MLYYTEQDSKRGKGYQHFHAWVPLSRLALSYRIELTLAHSTSRDGRTGVDPLDKAFTFFVQPPDPAQPDMKRLHRRVDLIFAGRKYYATAGEEVLPAWTNLMILLNPGFSVLGWTGSIQFERDLRLWAEHAR